MLTKGRWKIPIWGLVPVCFALYTLIFMGVCKIDPALVTQNHGTASAKLTILALFGIPVGVLVLLLMINRRCL